MKFCCKKFETHWKLDKRGAPNIRVVKFTSDWLVNKNNINFKGVNIKIGRKFRNSPYNFYITWGYEDDFSFDLLTLSIEYCPFCGTDLYKFYRSDEYANEIEGSTFSL